MPLGMPRVTIESSRWELKRQGKGSPATSTQRFTLLVGGNPKLMHRVGSRDRGAGHKPPVGVAAPCPTEAGAGACRPR